MSNIELKYPMNIVYISCAIAALVFFSFGFMKKERILAALRLDYKQRFKVIKTLLLACGLCLMVFALMGPRLFTGYARSAKTGLDIYVLIDTSKSMLVQDVAPDRMTVAKRVAENLLDSLEGDRIGFIPFASDAYIQMPLTDDYRLARMFLDVMDTEMIGGGGTNLAAAINLASESFKRSSGADMVILLISDGEEHDGEVMKAIKAVADESVKVFTVGVGTEKGGLIPTRDNAGNIVDYMKDSAGNPVTSRLNADTLRRVAREGRGAYYEAGSGAKDSAALINALRDLKRDEYKEETVRKYTPLYQYFLGPGIALFAIAWLEWGATHMSERRLAL